MKNMSVQRSASLQSPVLVRCTPLYGSLRALIVPRSASAQTCFYFDCRSDKELYA